MRDEIVLKDMPKPAQIARYSPDNSLLGAVIDCKRNKVGGGDRFRLDQRVEVLPLWQNWKLLPYSCNRNAIVIMSGLRVTLFV